MHLQNWMRLKLFGAIKKVSVGCQFPASIGSQAFGNIEHLWIEFANPLHFVFVVQVLHLDDLSGFYYNKRINALSLPLRNNPKNKSYKFCALNIPEPLMKPFQTDLIWLVVGASLRFSISMESAPSVTWYTP